MSLIIKLTRNGSSQEYLFKKPGPIVIGSDPRCDLLLEDPELSPKLLEVKVSGGNIFIKELAGGGQLLLDSVILPFRQEVRYHEGSCVALKESSFNLYIQKAVHKDEIEPPPFFEGEFKERLDLMNHKINEKESVLKNLDQKEEKRKNQLLEVDERYHKKSGEKGRLELEVDHLKAQKEILDLELRKNRNNKKDEENKVIHLKEHVEQLETEEKNLKETIVSQTLILANLRDDREKKSKEVEEQRILLADLELLKLKAEEELKQLKEDHESRSEEINLESGKVEKLLLSAETARREGARVQQHITGAVREKALLIHAVKELEEVVGRLDTQRKELLDQMEKVKSQLEKEEQHSIKVREEIKRQSQQEANLRIINNELREELTLLEEKLTLKKNQINQIEFQNQDLTRRLTTVNFELERSSLRLKELVSEEKTQEVKVMSLREGFQQFSLYAREEKDKLQKSFESDKSSLEVELKGIRDEIAQEKKHLAYVESQKNIMEFALEEMEKKKFLNQKDKQGLEEDLVRLSSQKNRVEEQIQDLKNETIRLGQDKDLALRELGSLKIKIQENEIKLKENMEESIVEMENYKREERSRMQAEKNVYLAEVEAFRQKSLSEVESEYRRKEADIHQQKILMLKESEQIIQEARQKEIMITEEADKRLRTVTQEAQERETTAHLRIKEAQEYFKEKEKEADTIIQRSRLEARDLIKTTELELQEDLSKRKVKIKKFLTMRQEKGLNHLRAMTEQHQNKLRRNEERSQEKLEDIKRRELKKVAKLRDEELGRHHEMELAMQKELRSRKEIMLKSIQELKLQQEAEINEKKKSMLEHVNQTKHRAQESWQEELRREKGAFERTKKARIENATQAVLNVFITENGPFDREPIMRDKIKATLEMAIDGQDANALKEMDQVLDFNPQHRKQILPVLQKYALRFGVPVAVATILITDMGSFRTGMVSQVQNLLQAQQSASEKYVTQQKTEWKEKHTFNPQTTPGYKATYVDNVLYTTDFDKVVENEEFQNDWILKVHDFMVKELELSEDLAINFISSEGTLVKELALARKDLHPQFLETGLQKLNAMEKTHLGWLQEKLTDPLKREKFSNFRRDYYDTFYQEKFQAKRSVASEVP